MKKNIVYFITGLGVGGAEMMLLKLLKASKEKNRFLIISLRNEGIIGKYIKDLGIPIFCLNLGLNTLIPIRILKLIFILRSYKPDIFHAWMYHANFFSFVISIFFPRVKNYWGIRQTLYDLDKEKFLTKIIIYLSKNFSSHCDLIIYNSKKSLLQHTEFGFSSHNSRFIPNGFDIELFAPNNLMINKFDKRNELNIDQKSLVIGMIARHHPMKGHEVMIRSALEILKKYPDLIFLFAGKDLNASRFMSLINNKNKKSFRFLDSRHDIPELLSILDIAVNASLWGEAFSNSIGEAMLMEIPCVATDVGDSKYILGDSGIIVKPNDISSLSLAIMQMVNKTPEERLRLGKKGRMRIVKNFSIENVSKEYASLY